MKFGNELWLILFREYISPNLFAVEDIDIHVTIKGIGSHVMTKDVASHVTIKAKQGSR
jgi:hypothetical protein